MRDAAPKSALLHEVEADRGRGGRTRHTVRFRAVGGGGRCTVSSRSVARSRTLSCRIARPLDAALAAYHAAAPFAFLQPM